MRAYFKFIGLFFMAANMRKSSVPHTGRNGKERSSGSAAYTWLLSESTFSLEALVWTPTYTLLTVNLLHG